MLYVSCKERSMIQYRRAITRTRIARVVREKNIDRLDAIKIDTDGNELSILRGAKEVLREFRPVILFEIATYLLDENQESFYEDFLKLLIPIGYKVFDSVSRRQVTDENIRQIVPPGGSVDLVAVQLDSRK